MFKFSCNLFFSSVKPCSLLRQLISFRYSRCHNIYSCFMWSQNPGCKTNTNDSFLSFNFCSCRNTFFLFSDHLRNQERTAFSDKHFHIRIKAFRFRSLAFRSIYKICSIILLMTSFIKRKHRFYFNTVLRCSYPVQKGSHMPVISEIVCTSSIYRYYSNRCDLLFFLFNIGNLYKMDLRITFHCHKRQNL